MRGGKRTLLTKKKKTMANIKHLQMWNTICTDARISVSKSLFGLRRAAVYNPTNSVIDVRTIKLSPSDGEHIKHILSTPREDLAQAIGDFRPKPVANGNYMAEVISSRDGAFLAVMLQQFVRMSYEPVTDVLVFEGDDARNIAKLF
jgi:hypothetical protein